ncbi:DUF2793 domain-containing protein [Cognatishimia sp. SS12]|uniref:DUF2793 domain-containing protein n=1 Tax=Cognatishimia sp. SS12 TaxID=2979465 RepID=UPI00232FF5BA|nr:DUF2793 domain-containing protein [Cognatishimia sp. SS12]MDC0739521.1 DUF2793 domain-containing protein [Cognatishimia sp. SS12]
MPDTSARLDLPLIAPAQAQKHVTHNEALLLLDGVTQLVLTSTEAEIPPAVTSAGELHALGANPSGDWAGQGGLLAQWQTDHWRFIAPQTGWRAWDLSAGLMRLYDGTGWQALLQNLPGVGIGTASDATNPLSVSGDATLLSHAGSDHQLKINKAADTDTAALLLQSGWTGHAEIGLTGDTDLHVKVSADGSTWVEAVIVDASSGHLSGAAVQSSASDVTPGKLARADYAYGPGNLLGSVSESGGLPTGAVIEQGSNANGEYVRFADGTQICTATLSLDINQTAGALFWSGAQTQDFAMPFVAAPHGSGSLQNTARGWINARASSSTAWAVSGFSFETRSGDTAALIAIGRWF